MGHMGPGIWVPVCVWVHFVCFWLFFSLSLLTQGWGLGTEKLVELGYTVGRRKTTWVGDMVIEPLQEYCVHVGLSDLVMVL